MKANYITPAVTAWTNEGNIDVEANKRIYDYLIEGGIDGILVMGSIGEFFAMTIEQKRLMIDVAIEHIGNRVKLIIGTNCPTIEETIELSNYALDKGIEGVIIISPYYFKLSEESVEVYYDQVARRCNGNVYLYNFPDRTGYDLSPEVTLRLVRKHKNIVGYKDTLANMDHTRKLIQLVKPEFPEFEIYSGFDENFTHNVISGGDGCIAGLSNIEPKLFSKLVEAAREDNIEMLSYYQRYVDQFMSIYDIGSNFIPVIKKAMILKNIKMQEYCSFPILGTTREETTSINHILQKINFNV